MKVAELIEKRRPSWQELEQICETVSRQKKGVSPEVIARFSSLYRAACADLALADSYQLPPNMVDYLHRLVAQAHNQLYRSRKFQWRTWYDRIFVHTPQLIFNDPSVHLVTILFWGLFFISAVLAYNDSLWPGFAENVVGEEQLEASVDMFSQMDDRTAGQNMFMMGFYIWHNASIGLTCFVMMLLVIPGMITLTFNAVHLGAVIGYMLRPELGDASVNFQSFITAHGPFELTAIVLSGGAGLKIGMGWLRTNGTRRLDSLVKTARETLPIMMCAVVLFCFAAVIEGFISPTTDQWLPWWVKGMVAVFSSSLLMIYFVVLGYPRNGRDLTWEQPDAS